MLRFTLSRVLPIFTVVTLLFAGAGIQPAPSAAQGEPMCVTYANGVERCIGMNGEGVPESAMVTAQAVTISAASEEAPLQLQPIDPEDLLPPPETVEPVPTPKQEQVEEPAKKERVDRDRDAGRGRDGGGDGKDRNRDGRGGRDDGRGGRDHDGRGRGVVHLIQLLRQIQQVRAGQFPVPHAPIFFIPCLILHYAVTHPEECGSVLPPGGGEGPRIT